MSDNSTTQCLLFPNIFPKPLAFQFDQRQGSSDGGALLLKAADRRYGLIGCLANGDVQGIRRRRRRNITRTLDGEILRCTTLNRVAGNPCVREAAGVTGMNCKGLCALTTRGVLLGK